MEGNRTLGHADVTVPLFYFPLFYSFPGLSKNVISNQ